MKEQGHPLYVLDATCINNLSLACSTFCTQWQCCNLSRWHLSRSSELQHMMPVECRKLVPALIEELQRLSKEAGGKSSPMPGWCVIWSVCACSLCKMSACAFELAPNDFPYLAVWTCFYMCASVECTTHAWMHYVDAQEYHLRWLLVGLFLRRTTLPSTMLELSLSSVCNCVPPHHW